VPLKTPAAERVEAALRARGFSHGIVELDVPVRSAPEAAAAVGCDVGCIVKSLVFRKVTSRAPLLLLVSGANRVDERKVAAIVGEPIERPDADFVRATTGFAIGGIPPLGHREPLETLIDEDLLKLDALWAAAGHPNSLFRLVPDELVKMTGGRVVPMT
jgi:prolyl-tRNA editing enzyme YbaK/EbsC (Cys-tRNA(Pro) deacylase)